MGLKFKLFQKEDKEVIDDLKKFPKDMVIQEFKDIVEMMDTTYTNGFQKKDKVLKKGKYPKILSKRLSR